MDTIRLRYKKELDSINEKQVLKLKGSLIAKGYTDIIHFEDDGQDFYINYFSANPTSKNEAIDYIKTYITDSGLTDIITLI